ncbi:glutamate 5-kinase [Paramaledivibacter caminithermalis]|jgi:glutamate 5-kinase|uniref:Glutamate 5-kinase n=1 Tax=Paramaledivibacter caminithermalis (strain DSM 15212 / CIP 107654 / DViRD3) TaxID=1121301 RepID=A0A1M6N272_PARC5|nr:glutamate 5-kinase [Paramaledivibacter caminithermalis]SHJ89768.1 glutamate 5-kinase [Paramaledivibacter caminithermalis DSM 15212]
MKICRSRYLKDIKRIVVKVGTSTLTHPTGLLDLNRIESIVRQLTNIHNQGIEIVLVSSGAIGAGMGKLGLEERPKTIPEKQAAAAVGQGVLLHMYEKLFSEYGKTVAQILLTKEDILNRKRFLNARNTFFTLFNQGVIPIVNENDAVVVDEIKFGDNDTLSAMVTSLVEADFLILLSDIDGLYDSNPKENPDAKLISYVDNISDEIKEAAGGAGTSFGTGGMITKIKAAEIAVSAGSSMIIVNGSSPNIINEIVEGKDIGTFFMAYEKPLKSRKCWIAYNTLIKGQITIDDGAVEALTQNRKSLLPAGIVSVDGLFEKGDIVSIVDRSGVEVARGITNYNSAEINLIKGNKTSNIEKKIDYKTYDEVIHANNMVITNKDNCGGN